MRTSTQKLLLLLYSQDLNRSPRLKLTELEWLLPEVGPAGRRSLVYLLVKRGWLSLFGGYSHGWLSLTRPGQQALEAQFPALNSFWGEWTGEWDQVVFLAPPASDKQFRYLRELLLKQRTLPVARGVYLWPSGFLPELPELFLKLYPRSVLVFNSIRVIVGDLKPIVFDYYRLEELFQHYSSISRSIDSLISTFKTKKRLITKERIRVLNLLEKILFCLQFDLGLAQFYLPDMPSPNRLVFKLQTLTKKLSH